MVIWSRLSGLLLVQRGYLMPWVPVFFATGIAGYFILRFEPSMALAIGVAVSGMALGLLASRAGPAGGPVLSVPALVCAGFVTALAHAHLSASAVLDFRYYGPIEGRVVHMDLSASGALRITLDEVRLNRVREVPDRVRISLHGDGGIAPRPGMRVMTTGHLGPPGGPVEPGGFDFRRHAWFLGLGAVGYTRVPLLQASDRLDGAWLTRMRMTLSQAVQARLPGEVGGFAAAITTGDRSGMSPQATEDLRRTNLSHLLAISGLHMGLLAGFVFATTRVLLNLLPGVGLRWPVRRIACVAAVSVGAVYLALSGGNVATERAFIMVAVALVAVFFYRRAISLRAVALAAMIVLLLRPEALLGPGFQMSFAATSALVFVFTVLMRDERIPKGPRWMRPVLAVAVSSAVAGLATAPIAAMHFNRFSQFGLIANLLSVPLMGVLVIPAAVVAACLAPFGLEGLPLWVMGQGLAWVLAVAHEIGSWEGVVRPVPTPGPAVLPLIAFGGSFLFIWRGRAAALGLLPLVAAGVLWAGAERPAVLVSERGGLVGVMEEEGRALSRSRTEGFVARVWLENDGDLAIQSAAAERWTQADEGIARAALPWGGTLWHVSGKRAQARFAGCEPGDVAVFSLPPTVPVPCAVHDPQTLRITGAVSYDRAGKRMTAAEQSGARLWSDGQAQ